MKGILRLESAKRETFTCKTMTGHIHTKSIQLKLESDTNSFV